MEEFFFLLFFAPIYTYIIVSREGTCQHIAAAKKKKSFALTMYGANPWTDYETGIYLVMCVIQKRTV